MLSKKNSCAAPAPSGDPASPLHSSTASGGRRSSSATAQPPSSGATPPRASSSPVASPPSCSFSRSCASQSQIQRPRRPPDMRRVDPAPPPPPPLRLYGYSPPQLVPPSAIEPTKSSAGILHLDSGARAKPPVVTVRILQVPQSALEASTRYVSLLRQKLSSKWARSPRRSSRTKQSVWRRLGSSVRQRRLGQGRGCPILNGSGNCARPQSYVWERGGQFGMRRSAGGINAVKSDDFARGRARQRYRATRVDWRGSLRACFF
jgi:hypothetical protein